jgi:hypothetical protein
MGRAAPAERPTGDRHQLPTAHATTKTASRLIESQRPVCAPVACPARMPSEGDTSGDTWLSRSGPCVSGLAAQMARYARIVADLGHSGRVHLAPFAGAAGLMLIDGGGNLITLAGRDGAI